MSNSILYAHECPVTDKISVMIPTVREIMENEDVYYSAITSIVATPYDFMVQLYDAGIDFDSITEFDLFILLFPGLQQADTRLVFGDLDLSKFVPAVNEKTQKVVLLDSENDIMIDRAIHAQICSVIRKIHYIEKVNKKPGNGEARKYMIERMRIKQRRAARRKPKSQLEDQIIAMVNTEQYKYDFMGTLDLTIYQFKSCVDQVIRKINYDNLMFGCYSGSIKASELSKEQLDWISRK